MREGRKRCRGKGPYYQMREGGKRCRGEGPLLPDEGGEKEM